ncbi:hypothetical protein AB0L49_47685 [Streptomyces antimycoticus]|uniref:hypothetical protein n=1 Tax=Streptomyces antimycoticus TaxID=68175 RepID=UPI00344A25DC
MPGTIAVSVVADPSHLEIVGPVAQGVVRAVIVRVERLYRFPEQELGAELARFPHDVEVRWVQEESGPRSLVLGGTARAPGGEPPGRMRQQAAGVGPPVGSARRHAGEQKDLVASAFR